MTKRTKKRPACGGDHLLQDARFCTDCGTAKETAKLEFVLETVKRIEDYASQSNIECSIDGGSKLSESAYLTVAGTRFRVSTHKDFHGNPMSYIGVNRNGVLAFGRHKFKTVESVIEWLVA